MGDLVRGGAQRLKDQFARQFGFRIQAVHHMFGMLRHLAQGFRAVQMLAANSISATSSGRSARNNTISLRLQRRKKPRNLRQRSPIKDTKMTIFDNYEVWYHTS